MTDFSVCSVFSFPNKNTQMGDIVLCGEFADDPSTAYDNYQKKAAQFINSEGVYHSCGRNAIRFIARPEGEKFFGTGSTPEWALSNIELAEEDHTQINPFSWAFVKSRIRANVMNDFLNTGEPIPLGFATLFFGYSRLCGRPEEIARIPLPLSCFNDPCSPRPCDDSEPCIMPEGVVGWESPAAKKTEEDLPVVTEPVIKDIRDEQCSNDPCSLNPCEPEVLCDDPDFYIKNGVFTPPQCELANEHTEEARIEKLFDAAPWDIIEN